jgi:glycosyltransferase involved in cell wall biosynthesis
MGPELLLTIVGTGMACMGTLHCAINRRLMRKPIRGADVTEPITILVPARNEEHRLAPLMESLRNQVGTPNAQIIVLDDASTDATLTVIKRAAELDDRVSVLVGDEEPPADWLGKPWACQRLLEKADGTVLVFIDADVVLEPDAVASAVSTMRTLGLAMVSPYPKQIAITPAERLIQPLLQWSWLTTLPLRVAETSPQPSLSAANGQLMVIDAEMLSDIGGFSSVKSEVLDDIALMRKMKSAGGRGGVIDGSDIATCRMYTSFRELVDGYTKSLWSAFGGAAASFIVHALLLLAYVLPPIMMLWPGSTMQVRIVALAGYVAGVAGRALCAQATRSRVWPDSLFHPVSIVFFTWLGAVSWFRHIRGTIQWKGRSL